MDGRRAAKGRGGGAQDRGAVASFKWLPVVSDYCTGCARCVDACPHQCLGLVWEFATLQRPERCTSDGDCAAACQDDAIRMDWVECAAEGSVGLWRDDPPPGPSPPAGRLGGLTGRLGWLRRR